MLASLDNSLWRSRQTVTERESKYIIVDGSKLINFSGNDYLGLSIHPEVIDAFTDAAAHYGLGSISSPLLSGYSDAHQSLEEAFAQFLGRDRALLFNSGYHANLAVITTFADRKSAIVADKFIHASLIDGISLSRADLHRYKHQDLAQADILLSNLQNKSKLLVTESVFSMDGDITDVNQAALLAKKHQAMLIIDDAHGIGINKIKLTQDELPCLITPLGKAPGSMGAIVSGGHEMIETLIQSARTYRYSTALPPAVCAATLVSLKLMQQETWRGEKLLSLIKLFNREAARRNIKLASADETPIRSILIGDNQNALNTYHKLREQGFLVSCIRPPSVPDGSARLRVSLSCLHEEEDIVRLLNGVASLTTPNFDSFNEATSSRERCDPTFIPGWSFKQTIWHGMQTNKRPLIGWSLGGLLSIQEYSRHPERYSHLILISSTPRFMRDENWEGISSEQADKQLSLAKCDMQRYQEKFLRLALHPDKSIEYRKDIYKHVKHFTSPELFQDLQTLFHLDLRDLFTHISVPVLQIIGEKDMVVTPQQSLQSKKLRNHTCHILPGAGHMLLSTHATQVTQLIQDFLC